VSAPFDRGFDVLQRKMIVATDGTQLASYSTFLFFPIVTSGRAQPAGRVAEAGWRRRRCHGDDRRSTWRQQSRAASTYARVCRSLTADSAVANDATTGPATDAAAAAAGHHGVSPTSRDRERHARLGGMG